MLRLGTQHPKSHWSLLSSGASAGCLHREAHFKVERAHYRVILSVRVLFGLPAEYCLGFPGLYIGRSKDGLGSSPSILRRRAEGTSQGTSLDRQACWAAKGWAHACEDATIATPP